MSGKPKPKIIEQRSDERGDYLALVVKHGTILIDAADRWVLTYGLGYYGIARFGKRKDVLRPYLRDENDKFKLMHRVLMGEPEGMTVDHIDGNTLNNRRYNLRLATDHRNKTRRHKHNIPNKSSQYRGVYYHRDGFIYSTFCENGKQRWLGAFPDEESAARAWDAECLRVRGEFAVLNFPVEAINAPYCRLVA